MSEIREAIRDLDEALDNLRFTLCTISHEGNPIIETLISNIQQDLENMNFAVSEFVQYRQTEILDDLLEERRLFDRSDKLLKECQSVFQQQSLYMWRKMSGATEQNKEVLTYINDKFRCMLDGAWDAHRKVHENINKNRTDIHTFIEVLKSESLWYFPKKELDQLKRETIQFKEYPGAAITNEVWGRVLGCFFDAMDMAINGTFKDIKEDDRRYVAYDKDEMTREYKLVEKCQRVMTDSELFDYEYAAEQHINLYSELKNENLILFFWLVNRHDMIICEMNPHLQNQRTTRNEPAYNIEDLTEEAKGWLLRKDIYPKLAKLLNDEVKSYVENTGTKATWDSIHFLFKHFSIVRARFSREKFAKLVTQIVPGVGEASALESMMEKSGMNWPPVKGFEIDKASSNVATALNPFYDKFKNL